jgi:hypothetical protein
VLREVADGGVGNTITGGSSVFDNVKTIVALLSRTVFVCTIGKSIFSETNKTTAYSLF